ncbi:tartrate dehydrogenase [Ancylobacter novellus DSM 506]|uniref:D-malate dehydrogenase [decarboxylating] n=1 Tax=Ancylobacter novellus (strain ATCC 8093 / DSM 506 / JCM 20403 / CCM 1077 / IAM 12100 / NBRC 12443 / NCIMB 10456) TaxID=639283 RepID=D7A9Y2_ANCN5|nr:tartrate dehydrogenase [Ancylobacter novellus]ADH88908.1 tartrate dehydrogenase [Ancylobacter novellus DSM 506]
MRQHKIALIPGDGIGSDVIQAGRRVLDALADAGGGFAFEFESFDWGSDRYRRVGRMMPEDGVDTLRSFDAIYFGAVGDPQIPDHITLWELRLAICQGLDQYANVRPSRLLPNIAGPLRPELGREIDWVIVRENSEGEYAGAGGRAHRGLPIEVGLDVSVFTRAGVARIARFACELAMSRPRRKLTVVTKSNAQRHGMVLWDEVCRSVVKDFPELDVDWMLVDAMTMRMVLRPGTIDTVLATNLHADVLSDLASALSGSLGIGATGNLAPDRGVPSMFEPIHGSGFDLIGKGIANPIGAFWTAVLMLDHLGESAAAARLMAAIEQVTEEGGVLTPDLGGTARTDDVTAAVIGIIKRQNDAELSLQRSNA